MSVVTHVVTDVVADVVADVVTDVVADVAPARSSEPAVNGLERYQVWLFFIAAIFLVSVPVFIQAPLVRTLPGLSLLATLGFVGWGWVWMTRPKLRIWGDLILGFSLSWLAGSIYWGWLRWEPFLHLPIEAIGLPLAVWFWVRGWGKVGSCFYLGSLLGTAITDLYFYLVNLIPDWRQLMQIEPELALTVLQQAVTKVKTPWGVAWVVILGTLLLTTGCLSLRSRHLHWWTFGGAVLGTILVDGLFWLAAAVA